MGGNRETLQRLEATLAAMERLQRFRGHFYNWYDTRDLRRSIRDTYPRSTAATLLAI